MHLHPDQIRHFVSDRQRELRSEAEAHRLAGSTPARTRAAGFLRRAADRIDAATSSCGHVRRAALERA